MSYFVIKAPWFFRATTGCISVNGEKWKVIVKYQNLLSTQWYQNTDMYKMKTLNPITVQ